MIDRTDGRSGDASGERHFRELADFAPVMIWRSGLDKGCDWFNARWLNFTGRPLEAELGTGWSDAVHPDDRARCVATYETAFDARETFVMEFRLRRADGDYRWIRDAGAPYERDGVFAGYFGSCVDITEAREALSRSQDRHVWVTAMADAIPALVSYVDAQERYTYVNAKYQDWFDVRAEDVLGRQVRDLLGEVAYARVKPFIDRALAGERVTTELSLPYARGRPRDVQADYVPDIGPDGAVRGYFALVQDVSDRKSAEDALKRLNETLEHRVAERTAELEAALSRLRQEAAERAQAEELLRHAQKMEAIGQLTGGVAHDFNNLLTPVIGSLDLLSRRLGSDPKARAQIDVAMAAAERAANLVQRLLAFARRQDLDPRPVDIARLVAGIGPLIDRAVGPSIELDIAAPKSLPPVFVDASQLETALINLCVNARDAMPQGGTVRIEARPARADEMLGLEPGAYIAISVVDGGEGMDAATLARAIDPFFSTKGPGKGTGLGLSMVHGLAAQSGGALRLRSALGQGTTATLILPRASEPATEAALGAADAPIAFSAGRVLLVDDEDLARATTAELLRELGFDVVEASGGPQALERLDADATIKAVVTDFLMPGMNGRVLIERARERRPDLPAMIITGFADREKEPLDGFIWTGKPFKREDLLAGLTRALAPR